MVVYLRKVFTANLLARYIVLQICFIFFKKKEKTVYPSTTFN